MRASLTHAVIISNNKGWEEFIGGYENSIRRRDIPEDEKERLICKLNAVWGKGKPENPRGAAKHGVKQIIRNDDFTVGQTTNLVAEYFGLT